MLLTKICSLIITKVQLQVHLEYRGKTTHGGNNLAIQNVEQQKKWPRLCKSQRSEGKYC